ncbi:hypothetical protein MMAG44476_36431 [Mycolicibacterium mageritense DSM 44476 = CIP 104973]|uniref:Uncharacterized protein n=1 Tax=Mycolicibacterium mageritense TaxID=53462 RepID=A0ABN5Y724_MYCME|nr:hypothetical protein [Mycolicibacterium mageritense]MCC9185579.1 hypothetical protein [Mycolicibacterium mageritense]BBX33928.1 hypothetical protein MMAGJ_32100 [Mycolicibacterium mageritense]CDO22348.1 hypothetical protein BN978_02821 [Mycolicibacterium mageritense DSM 44476 = CIP 104973]
MAETEDIASKHAQYYEQTSELLQGTVLRAVRVYEETAESTDEAPEVRPQELDVIVLTQSCDIAKQSQRQLLVAEVQQYSDMVKERAGTESAKDSYKRSLIRNTAVSDMLLPPCALLGITDYLIVNFRELHTIFKHRVCTADSGFVSLASPFREHLSQHYASFTMRVGLPTPPLHEFEKYRPEPS